jgi:hypothetical protein
MSDRPIQESAEPLPAVEPELFEQAKAAVQALRGSRGQRVGGRFTVGNFDAGKTGMHSRQLQDLPDVAAWHRERVAAITGDLGGADELSALQQGLVREVARLEVVVAALGEDVLAHGTLTGKGRTRGATNVWLSVLDRYSRLAQQLGLQRRQRQVATFQEAVRGGR